MLGTILIVVLLLLLLGAWPAGLTAAAGAISLRHAGPGLGHRGCAGLAGPDLTPRLRALEGAKAWRKRNCSATSKPVPTVYRLAADVVRDRRFDDDERLEILRAWAGQADGARLEQIGEAIADISRRKALRDHAAE